MKLIAAVTAFVDGVDVNVARVCRDSGVSRKTFYKWAARYRAEGLVGFEERSRRPLRVPGRTAAEVEDVIVRLRGELARDGLDHGATTIQWHLGQSKLVVKVPSVATVHRVLVRRGLVEAQPHKKPKVSWKRFEASAPNERWQIDAMDWVIATGMVRVFNILDDHSRVVVRSRAVFDATTVEAWATFCQGSQTWGLPVGVLSDNGLCFSGKLHRIEVGFEKNLRDVGILPSTGRPFHPQTTGKVERFQQTLKKWLRMQRLARNLAELQAQLDRFCHVYNFERPHQGIGRQRPIERWQATPVAVRAGDPLEHPVYEPLRPTVRTAAVCQLGKVSLDKHNIHIGAAYEGATATVIFDGRYATVYIDDELVRHLKIDPTRRYQPSGKPRGGTRQQRRLAS